MARTSLGRALLVAAVVSAGWAFGPSAHAGGMTVPGRGARPLGRAGSFVAGADDGEAMIYNPAGLAEIDGIGLLLDGGLVLQRTHYARIDSGGNPQPAVDGNYNFLPFPTLVVSWKPKRLPWLTVAAGVWVPYLGLNSYPENGAQRYSSISLDGSIVAVLNLSAAFRLNDHIFLGAGFQGMYLRFRSLVDLGACPELNCAPEDPHFDSLTQLTATAPFVPSANVGAQFVWQKFRVGASLQLPFFIHANGEVRSRLPTDPFFTNAEVHGSAASIDLTLPLILRAGVEARPLPTLRIELGFDLEAWSMQKELTIRPKDIYISGVPGIGNYYLNTLHVVRDLDNSYSVHLGAEWEALKRKLVVRAGYLFETSATPNDTLSVLTSDGLHNMITLGLGVRMFGVRWDVGYAHLFTQSRDVTNSRSLQLNPIQPSLAVPVGNGHYDIDTDIISIGLDARF